MLYALSESNRRLWPMASFDVSQFQDFILNLEQYKNWTWNKKRLKLLCFSSTLYLFADKCN